jgi:uroporphyrin-III C-methyltransferase/precorrin-2 dehydrogenase/sirohydrochlorin ferrochelatase
MTTGMPLLLDLSGRRVVVAGGGAVAARRLRALLDSGADDVLVVAREATPALRQVLGSPDASGVTVLEGDIAEQHLAGAWLVFACTSDADANARVAAAAARQRVFCVQAGRATGGSARTAATARLGDITVGVNASDDPRRARDVRDAIARAAELGTLPMARRRGDGPGRVALVGGGPGDPGLITVRGRRLLAEADVVVVDRLAPRALLAELGEVVEVIDCGKSPHHHTMTQDEINAVLVERALAGRRVVRLKGGDPFVFGRGSEEVQACVAAGVPVEVVPGISSALAAPAAAGIPVTHRGLGADVAIVSGHLDPDPAGDSWGWLATGPSTLVLLMAMGRLRAIADALIAGGRDAATPAAVVQHGTTARQRTVRAPLSELADAVEASHVGSPAVVVIGDVAALGADGAVGGTLGGTVGGGG